MSNTTGGCIVATCHGVCRHGVCLCGRFFVGDTCETDFRSLTDGMYGAYQVATVAIHTIVVAFTACTWPKPWQWCGARRADWNRRHLAAGANCLASVLRLVWLLHPGSPSASQIEAYRVIDAALLRLPQILWLLIVLLLIRLWTQIASGIKNQAESRLSDAFAVIIVVTACLTLPLSVFGSFRTQVDPVIETGGSLDVAIRFLVGFVLVLLCVWGVISTRRLSAIAQFFFTRAQHSPAVVRLQAAVRNITVTCSSIVVGAVLLTGCVVAMSATSTSPTRHPMLFMGYLIVIHSVIEGLASVMLAYSTFQPCRPVVLTLEDAESHMLLSQSDGDTATTLTNYHSINSMVD